MGAATPFDLTGCAEGIGHCTRTVCRAGTYAAHPYREGDGELGGGDLAD